LEVGLLNKYSEMFKPGIYSWGELSMFIWRVALLQVANQGIVGTLRNQTKCVQNSLTRDLFFGMEPWGSFSGCAERGLD